MTDCMHIQEESCHDKTPVHTINIQSFTASVSELTLHYISLTLVDHVVQVSEEY